ncbi:MAG: hypothetical protein SynsKO_14520 [Synoicihabitans sp.]
MKLLDVWVVEDDANYRRMLARILGRTQSINLCRVFPGCPEMLAAIDADPHPDVILMDLGLPRMSGLEGIKELMRIAPEIAIIALTAFGQKQKVINALEAGVSGYLLKSASAERIIAGIADVYAGGSALSPPVARIVLDNLRTPPPDFELKLAARELQVLEELALGKTVKEIADTLSISESTVSTYLGRIYAKLEVQSQSGAVAKALRRGLIR